MTCPRLYRRVAICVGLAMLAAFAGWRASVARAEARCKLQGQVTTLAGAPIAGVTVRFSNGLRPQVTDALGYYAVAAPADGQACVVTPEKLGYRFLPAEKSVWLSGDGADASFQAKPEKARRSLDTPLLAALGAVDVSVFAINNGEDDTTSPDVTLDNVCVGSPTYYMASELPSFTGATWLPYSTSPTFTLSAGNDTKTVYFRVTDGIDMSSDVFDSIYLNEAEVVELIVNDPVKTGYAWPAADEDWFFFTAATDDTYTIQTWPGTLTDTYVELYAADQTTLIAADDNSGEGACSKIVQALTAGTYYVKVRSNDAAITGTYRIRVTTGDKTVTILSPHGDPAANTQLDVGNAEVVFSSSSPGVLEVTCRFAVSPGAIAGFTDRVRACIEPVGNSPLAWTSLAGTAANWSGSASGRPATAHNTMGEAVYNATANRYEIKAVFTGLPPNNSGFGPKKLWAQIVSGAAVVAEAEQPLEVFYPRAATNNAGAGTNAGPNWFYYWKTGNVCGITTGWEYENDPTTYGFYWPGDDHIDIADASATWNSGPEYYYNDLADEVVVSGQGIGPHCCTEVIAHEGLHKWIYETWAPLIEAAEADGEDNGDDYDDPDDDGIPNVFEPLFLSIVTDPNDPDTWNMGGPYSTYGDQEIRCRKLELTPGLTVTDAADWAYPGTNSYPQYPKELTAPIDDAEATGGQGGEPADEGNPGNDHIHQHGDGNDNVQTANGGGGDDTIRQEGAGGADVQTANGGTGIDIIKQRGGGGNDIQTATGGDGDDRIIQRGKHGSDTLVADGGAGNDFIRQKGGRGADTLTATGGDGNDTVIQCGGNGDDNLVADGGAGDDFIWQKGGSGSDTLSANGGDGNDTIWMLGGDGADTFTYQASAGTDQVVIRGGGGPDTATIYANGQSFTLKDPKGTTLYQKGTGGSTITAHSISTLTVIGDDGISVVYTGSAR